MKSVAYRKKLKQYQQNRTCYYFDDTMRDIDIYSGDIFMSCKTYENILIHDISYKKFYGFNAIAY